MTSYAAKFGTDQVPARMLCIDQFANFGGGQRSLLDLLPAFSERGWNPSVAIPGEGPLPIKLRALGYQTHSFTCGAYASRNKPLNQMLRYASEIPKLVSHLTEIVELKKIDLLYVNGPRMVPPAAWVAWRKGLPLIFHCHNRPLQSSAIALTGQALELAGAHVIACCQYVAEPLREYVEPERLRILYNGVRDMSGSRKSSDRLQPIRHIGVIGRIEAEKGQLEFVQAARLILQQFPDCRFSMVGSPMFSDSTYYGKVVAASRGLPVDFVEWRQDIASTFSDLDLLVVPSSAIEATTRVIPEAFSAGVPVLAFAAGGIPEVLRDEDTGFLAAGMSVKALSERILSVMRMDTSRLANVIVRARDQWKRRFTLGGYRENVCSVVSKAMHLRDCRGSVVCH
jgi:glycosyltransferase involved in cell wall biosynthesis